jgi:pimeloyl-ACP methyl ester carboxylesterase
LDKQDGPVILVGHSYGGAVITEAGVHSKVVGLVYVDGFQPDAGESALDKAMSAPDLSGGAVLPPDAAGFLYIDKAKFHSAFCADLPAGLAAFMEASQAPISIKSFAAKLTQAAWKTKPSWGIVGTGDKSINPVILRAMYTRSNTKVTEISGASHVSFISHPKEVTEVIITAAKSVGK